MRKHIPQLEWQFVENKDDLHNVPWPPLGDMPPSIPATRSRLRRCIVWGGIAALLLLLAATGGWLWQRAEAGLDQVEEELSDAVQLELVSGAPIPTPQAINRITNPAAMVWQAQLVRERAMLPLASPSDLPVALPNATVHMVNLQDDLAVADFVTTAQDGTQAYRQTRFYQLTAQGWQRTMPQAELWGLPRDLESAHFIFHFRHNDAAVISEVAPQVDAIYEELQRNFGLSPTPNKLAIEVTVERTTGAIITPQWDDEPLLVPSPALYLAPAELDEGVLLVQSIALPLVDHMAERAIKEHSVPLGWRPLISGMKLWQLWDVKMPLGQWHYGVVNWLYTRVPADDPERNASMPERYPELCSLYRLWMMSPVLIGIPLECLHSDNGGWVTIGRLAHEPPLYLDELRSPPNRSNQFYDAESYLFHSAPVVAEETILEYAIDTYGYEQLPTLLAGLAHYDDWETLLPAVYGVSSVEFEAGWQTYMAKKYSVQLNQPHP